MLKAGSNSSQIQMDPEIQMLVIDKCNRWENTVNKRWRQPFDKHLTMQSQANSL